MLKIGEIVQTVKGIVETRISIVKREIQEEFVSILSRLVLLFVVGSFMILALIFLSLSLAFYLSQVTQSPYLGFLIVALVYLLAVIGLYLTRDSFRLQKKAGNILDDFVFKSRKRKENHE